ncbi:hypothetical protein OG874_07500 [Nocardia sp. NBC_00565]|uniref:hypothetical protein n=1 Tax=Nocardia sp. NBC_00565 TaxID=2975993 RepID=UPI002E802234|nr:hypothetical protein [Nocardia sp. NBC_00565]WUC04992.1 hypothetical protein OG874_07500 [Nocardia sp. NBC_00565]
MSRRSCPSPHNSNRSGRTPALPSQKARGCDGNLQSRHEGGKLTFIEVEGGTRVVWTTTAEAALPFAADAVTRALAPVILYSFGKVLDAAESALAQANR